MTVQDVTRDDIEPLARLLAEAFQEDPFHSWIFLWVRCRQKNQIALWPYPLAHVTTTYLISLPFLSISHAMGIINHNLKQKVHAFSTGSVVFRD
jgi:hypothetical protein